MDKLLVLGFGGHAKSVVDAIESMHSYKIAGFISKKEDFGKEYRGYHVIGCDEDLASFYQSGITNAVIAIGYLGHSSLRDKLCETLQNIGYTLPPIVDASAIVASDVTVCEGVFVGKGAVINSAAVLHPHCIINTRAIVEHDCIIGAFSHIAVNATLCGQVSISDHVFIGANATILQEKHIASNCIIGANALIYKNIPANTKVYGPSPLNGVPTYE